MKVYGKKNLCGIELSAHVKAVFGSNKFALLLARE